MYALLKSMLSDANTYAGNITTNITVGTGSTTTTTTTSNSQPTATATTTTGGFFTGAQCVAIRSVGSDMNETMNKTNNNSYVFQFHPTIYVNSSASPWHTLLGGSRSSLPAPEKCLQSVREYFWPDGSPRPPPSSELSTLFLHSIRSCTSQILPHVNSTTVTLTSLTSQCEKAWNSYRPVNYSSALERQMQNSCLWAAVESGPKKLPSVMDAITQAVNDVPAFIRCATDDNNRSSSSTSVISSCIQPARAVENLRASDLISVRLWVVTSAQDVVSQLLVRIQPISWQTEEVKAFMVQGHDCNAGICHQNHVNNNDDDDGGEEDGNDGYGDNGADLASSEDQITGGDAAHNTTDHHYVPIPTDACNQNTRRKKALLLVTPLAEPTPRVPL